MNEKSELRGTEAHGTVEMTKQGLVIPALTVIVGQACSLRCKHCANFSPYAPKRAKHYPLEQICEDLRLIFMSVYRIKKIQVQGGEPLLYQELPELLDFIRSSGKVDTLTIATNGTILPEAYVLDALRRNHVRVRISEYPVVSNETVRQLKEQLNAYDIEIWAYQFASNDSMWYDMGGVSISPGIESEENVQRRFINCPFHDCFTLEDGKISRCGRAVMAEQLQGFVAKEQDLLSISPSENLETMLWKYLKTQDYMEACRYCHGAEGEKVIPAQQLTKI